MAVRRRRRSASTISSRIAVIEERTEKILEQTTKTNGRVNRHDEWIAEHTAESHANTDSLKALAETVNCHTALINKVVGAWWALGAVATAAGSIIGLIVGFADRIFK